MTPDRMTDDERAWYESESILADLAPLLDESRRRRIAGAPREHIKVTVREIGTE